MTSADLITELRAAKRPVAPDTLRARVRELAEATVGAPALAVRRPISFRRLDALVVPAAATLDARHGGCDRALTLGQRREHRRELDYPAMRSRASRAGTSRVIPRRARWAQ